jgi:hypothetical protein
MRTRNSYFLAILVFSATALFAAEDFAKVHPVGALFSLLMIFLVGTAVCVLLLRQFRHRKRRKRAFN